MTRSKQKEKIKSKSFTHVKGISQKYNNIQLAYPFVPQFKEAKRGTNLISLRKEKKVNAHIKRSLVFFTGL